MRACSVDYIGMRFGKIFITGIFGEGKKRIAEFKCDCGQVERRSLNNIISGRSHGNVISCKKCGRVKDRSYLIGKRYGRLLIIDTIRDKHRYRNSTKITSPYAICNCDCGKQNFKALVSDIERGSVVSCGCRRKETYTENSLKKNLDMIGKRVGKWTIIAEEFEESKYAKHKGRVRYFICKCDCGNMGRVIYSNLYRGLSRSCGCTISGKRNTFSRYERTIEKYFNLK